MLRLITKLFCSEVEPKQSEHNGDAKLMLSLRNLKAFVQENCPYGPQSMIGVISNVRVVCTVNYNPARKVEGCCNRLSFIELAKA